MTTDCPTCGVTFEVSRDRKRYCSMGCRRGAAQTARVCDGCGVTFKTFRSDPQRYHDRDCWAANHSPQATEVFKRPCASCGEEMIFTKASVAKYKKYCDRKCLGKANGARRAAVPKVRVVKDCKVCGKRIEVIPSLAERKTTCSRRCNGLQALMSSRPRTSRIGDDAIMWWAGSGRFGRDLDWQPELRVSRWTIDLAFPALMLAIELDGAYWHSRPGMAAKDERKDADLAGRGWRIHHIPIEDGDSPEWLGRCIDIAIAKVAHADELGYMVGHILEAS